MRDGQRVDCSGCAAAQHPPRHPATVPMGRERELDAPADDPPATARSVAGDARERQGSTDPHQRRGRRILGRDQQRNRVHHARLSTRRVDQHRDGAALGRHPDRATRPGVPSLAAVVDPEREEVSGRPRDGYPMGKLQGRQGNGCHIGDTVPHCPQSGMDPTDARCRVIVWQGGGAHSPKDHPGRAAASATRY